MKPGTLGTFLRETVIRHELFQPGDTLVVGFSGGADSMALLHLLHSLAGFDLMLVAAHLNHSLRGEESDGDQRFCREVARNLGVTFECEQVDLRCQAAENGDNLEDAGRQARIAFFDRLQQRYQARAVLLAHHADDQAETVLMRLLRGSGSKGLAGISYRNQRGYLRPLLQVTRNEILAYLAEHQLNWRDDSSNNDCSYLRNRIRHELLPLLEGYNPAIRQRLAANAELFSDDEDLLHSQALQSVDALCCTTDSAVSCPIPELFQRHRSLVRRCIRIMYQRCCGTLTGLGQQHVDQVMAICLTPHPHSSCALPHGVVASREYDTLVLARRGSLAAEVGEHTVTGEGDYRLWNGMELTVSLGQPAWWSHQPDPDTIVVDLERVPFPWTVRTFQPGDRLQPLGMTGSKKVKDILIDAKIPLSQRRTVPLLFSGETLIWLAGLRMSQLAALHPASTAVAKVCLKQQHR